MYINNNLLHYSKVHSEDKKMADNSLLQGLNPEQQKGVLHHEGPILILAGAGSGKTRVLTHRIANLVRTHKVRPQQILAVTFTNKAANEMKSRLRGLLGEQADLVWAGTFHSICLRILRRHAKLLGYSPDFVVYDDQDSKGVMKQVLKELGLSDKKYPVQSFLSAFDYAKNAYILPEEFGKNTKSAEASLQAQAYELYQKALMRANAMDFGDLLVNAVRLFEEHPETRQYYQGAIRFALVDEFQDTNKVQYLFLSYLTGAHKNLFVVGDDDQSIYSFRGASIDNILNFEKDFAGSVVVRLEQNYRSTSAILDLSHAVIEKNKRRKDKKLWTSGPRGESVSAFSANDELDEAAYVASKIKEALAAGANLKDFAIFYRTNAQSRAIEEALIKESIPYRIFGGLKFYERKEIKDILAYARLIVNDQDNQAFDRVINTPTRGIGPQKLRQIQDTALENGSSLFEAAKIVGQTNPNIGRFVELITGLQARSSSLALSELLEQIIEKSEYGSSLRAAKDPFSQSRLENLAELVAIGRSIELDSEDASQTLRGFLDRVALTASSDIPSEGEGAAGSEAVSLMTLHLAKGLEFPIVFLTGLEEGLLPHYRSMYDPTQVEEERRLTYVGITRAMKKLFMTRASFRGMFSGSGFGGGGAYRPPSRFIADMPQELIDCETGDFAGDSYRYEPSGHCEPEGAGTSVDLDDEPAPDKSGFETRQDLEYVDPDGTTLRSFFKRKKSSPDRSKKPGLKIADDLD